MPVLDQFAQMPSFVYVFGESLPESLGTRLMVAAGDDFFSIVFSGGVFGIGITIALLLLSLLVTYLIVDQALALRRRKLLPPEALESLRQLLAQGRIKEAEELCGRQPSPLAFVVGSGLSELEFGWPAVEKAIEEATAEQAAQLYRRIEYLQVLGNLAPMLGLLGTVYGMIIAFREVAVSQGTAGAGDLASGIYSALVTTVLGLLIAIPAIAAFAILRNRVDEVIAQTLQLTQQVFQPIRRRLPGALAVRSAATPTKKPGV